MLWKNQGETPCGNFMLRLCTHEILGRALQERILGAIGGGCECDLGSSIPCSGGAKAIPKKVAD
jgi:hypothetical protein